MMNVTIIGTGYVGLISGVCLAEVGHKVLCVDLNLKIVNDLNLAIPTIYEKGLPELLEKVVSSRNFSATNRLDLALEEADIVLIAVGTPSKDGAIDLSAIKTVCQSIGEYIKNSEKYISVVLKSTVIPSTTDTVVRNELEKFSGKKLGDFGLGMNPEFLREGNAIEDFCSPDRIIFGYEDEETLSRLVELYKPWDVEKLAMNTRSAELLKYANNTVLATQISIINELANMASALGGIDFQHVVKGLHLDKRWSPLDESGNRISPEILTYLRPGCGFGGSCFPKDIQALRSQGEMLGLDMAVSNAVLSTNDHQPFSVVNILARRLGGLSGKKILVLGLSFKPETDDVRESPAIKIMHGLIKENAIVSAHDPIAVPNFIEEFGASCSHINFCEDWRSAVKSVSVVVIITPWVEYLDLKNIYMKDKTVFDARAYFRNSDLEVFSYLTFGTS